MEGYDLDLDSIRSMLTVIAIDEDTRKSIPYDEEELQFGYDEWRQEHWPLVNNMYLLVMVAIWHSVERELVLMAARVGSPESKKRSRFGRADKYSAGKAKRFSAVNTLCVMTDSRNHAALAPKRPQ